MLNVIRASSKCGSHALWCHKNLWYHKRVYTASRHRVYTFHMWFNSQEGTGRYHRWVYYHLWFHRRVYTTACGIQEGLYHHPWFHKTPTCGIIRGFILPPMFSQEGLLPHKRVYYHLWYHRRVYTSIQEGLHYHLSRGLYYQGLLLNSMGNSLGGVS